MSLRKTISKHRMLRVTSVLLPQDAQASAEEGRWQDTQQSILKWFFVVLLLFALSIPVFAEDENKRTLNFTVSLLGASHFSDVDAVKRGLRRVPQMERIWESRVSRGLIEFSGEFRGNESQLVADLMSAASGRFTYESQQSKEGRVMVTFRKIGAP